MKNSTVSLEKLRLIKVLQILKNHSNRESALTSGKINAYLEREGIKSANRNTISSDIATLQAAGVAINQLSNRYGWYYQEDDDTSFSCTDNTILNCMLEASSLNDFTKNDLKLKIRKNTLNSANSCQITLSNNINVLNSALKENRCVKFHYLYISPLSKSDPTIPMYKSITTIKSKNLPVEVQQTLDDDAMLCDKNATFELIPHSNDIKSFTFHIAPIKIVYNDGQVYLLGIDPQAEAELQSEGLLICFLIDMMSDLKLSKEKSRLSPSDIDALARNFMDTYYDYDNISQFAILYALRYEELDKSRNKNAPTSIFIDHERKDNLYIHCHLVLALLLNKKFHAKVSIWDKAGACNMVEVCFSINITKKFMRFMANYRHYILDVDFKNLCELYKENYIDIF